MPQRECIALASLAQYDLQIARALLRCAVLKIESRQSSAEFRGRIFEIRRPGPDLRPCSARCACRDEGLVAIQFESHPPERCAHHPRARIVHLQGVGAAQVHRYRRRSVDDKFTGRRPDIRMNRSTIQSNPLQSRPHAQQPQACARVHLDLADIVRLKASP